MISTRPLLAHQDQLVQMVRGGLRRYGLFWEPGCTKTGGMLAATADEKLRGRRIKTLVVCPLSVMHTAWAGDAKFFPSLKLVIAWHKNRAKRMELIYTDDADVLVTNPETFKAHSEDFYNAGVRKFIFDESSKVKSCRALPGGESQITKVSISFSDAMDDVFMLSGTPAANTEVEYFSQVRCIDKSVFGWNSYGFVQSYFTPINKQIGLRMKMHVRDQFSKVLGRNMPGQYQILRHPQVMSYLSQAKLQPHLKDEFFEPVEKPIGFNMRPNRKDEFLSKLNSVSWFLKARDCIDLPEETDVMRDVTLGDAEKKAYASMLEELRVEFVDGEVVNATTNGRMMKLRQITGGSIIDAGVPREIGTSKLDALDELIDELGNRQLVVWADFTHEINGICRRLAGRGLPFGRIDGTVTSAEDRAKVVRGFQAEELRYAVCHPQACGHGITLTAARYDCYYSLGWVPENHEQARRRILRMGQRWPVTHYYLISPGTVDERVLSVLQRKSTQSDAIKVLLGGKVRGLAATA
jgi:SNF2 family DNA or RNA helicase